MLLFHPQFSKNNNYSKIIIRNSFRLFLLITIQLVVVSLITKAPSKEILEDFEAVKKGQSLEV